MNQALDRLDDETDAALCARVARRDVDPEGARCAQAELYKRHLRFLYGALLRHERGLLAAAKLSAEDVVQDTFHRAFEKAHTFHADESLDADRQRQRTRAWLGRIAHNLLVDELGRSREIAASHYLEKVGEEPPSDEPVSSRSPSERLVAEGLEQLSERERDVLAVTAEHHRPGEHQRLPNEVSAELASRWGTTNENIRAIRMRAMKKLKSFLASRGMHTEEAP